MKKEDISVENIEVLAHGQKMTLKECAENYDVDYEILIKEYLQSGNINESISHATTKKQYMEAMTDYIKETDLDKMNYIISDIFYLTRKNSEKRNETLSYIINSQDEKLELSKDDLILLLKNNDLLKPKINGKEKEIIDLIYNFIINSDKNTIKISKENAIKLIDILNNYSIPKDYLDNLPNIDLMNDKTKEEDLNKVPIDYITDDGLIIETKNKTLKKRK